MNETLLARLTVFVIVTSDRDIIPLLMAFKYEGKFSYLISTRTGFNRTVAEYADFHEYVKEGLNFQTSRPYGNVRRKGLTKNEVIIGKRNGIIKSSVEVELIKGMEID